MVGRVFLLGQRELSLQLGQFRPPVAHGRRQTGAQFAQLHVERACPLLGREDPPLQIIEISTCTVSTHNVAAFRGRQRIAVPGLELRQFALDLDHVLLELGSLLAQELRGLGSPLRANAAVEPHVEVQQGRADFGRDLGVLVLVVERKGRGARHRRERDRVDRLEESAVGHLPGLLVQAQPGLVGTRVHGLDEFKQTFGLHHPPTQQFNPFGRLQGAVPITGSHATLPRFGGNRCAFGHQRAGGPVEGRQKIGDQYADQKNRRHHQRWNTPAAAEKTRVIAHGTRGSGKTHWILRGRGSSARYPTLM